MININFKNKQDNFEHHDELIENANKLVKSGKGILAADESPNTLLKRFKDCKIENTVENRIEYRHLLFSTENLEKYISGCILHDETLHQKYTDNELLINNLKKKNILLGIKVDTGLEPLPGSPEETTTRGFDKLNEKCEEYYKLGIRFAKWRTTLKIKNNELPTELSIKDTAYTLANYAFICQKNGLVPIVEPEILTDGDHNIEKCAKINEKVLNEVFYQLRLRDVLIEGILLKPNMVTSGSNLPHDDTKNIANYTVRTLIRTCPISLPGVVFLSGGQSEYNASLNLNMMNKLFKDKIPFKLSFSYGRALQASTIKAWGGDKTKIKSAQNILLARAKDNSDATLGNFNENKNNSNKEELHVDNYVY